MIFNSPLFLFAFLPLFFIIYFCIPKKYKNIVILIASITFYSFGERTLVLLLLGVALIDYIAGLLFLHIRKSQLIENKKRMYSKIVLTISIILNLGILCFFKYFNFGIDSFNTISNFLGLDFLIIQNTLPLALPLGISFFTFQSMSYTIDAYRGDIVPTKNLINYFSFVTLFPQLIAGPIIRYKDIAVQLVDRIISVKSFSLGIERFIIGLAKKVLIADAVGITVNYIFSLPLSEINFSLAWMGIILFSIQIFFDFSGYSDMAIGLGRMMGFTFPENFNYPFFARSMHDLWNRWHISLISWFRDYVFIPLGGSYHGTTRTALNIFVVFFLSGLWHGSTWLFVIWGIWHGIFLLCERFFIGKYIKKMPFILQHGYVLLIWLFGGIFFRAENFLQAKIFLQNMVGLQGFSFTLLDIVNGQTIMGIILGISFSVPLFIWTKNLFSRTIFIPYKQVLRAIYLIFLIGLFILTLSFITGEVPNAFIYFRF